MRILISAALGALALVASPASAQYYKAGTVTATPRTLEQERAARKQHERPAVQPFYKPGVPGFTLQPPTKRADTAPSSDAANAAPDDAKPCDCCGARADTSPGS